MYVTRSPWLPHIITSLSPLHHIIFLDLSIPIAIQLMKDRLMTSRTQPHRHLLEKMHDGEDLGGDAERG